MRHANKKLDILYPSQLFSIKTFDISNVALVNTFFFNQDNFCVSDLLRSIVNRNI